MVDEKNELLVKQKDLLEKNKALKNKVNELKLIIDKFFISSQNLYMSMDKQNMTSKANYNSFAKLKSSKVSIGKYHFDKKFIIYFKCNKAGHKLFDYQANTFKNKRIK